MVEDVRGIVLYCLPGKVWALGFSYPGTSSHTPRLRPGLLSLRFMASSRRSCQTAAVHSNTETQRLQRFSSRGSPCLVWLYTWTSSRVYMLRSWRLPDAPVAEGDTSSMDDRHRLSPAKRATVGVTHRQTATGCRPEGNCRLLRADAHKKRSQPQ